MGRHSSDNRTSGVAKELIYGVIAVVVVIALLAAWFLVRGKSADSHDNKALCPAGDLSVPFALLGETKAATKLQDEFIATHPMVQDYCITGFSEAPLAEAALVYSNDSDAGTKAQLAAAQQSAASSDWPIVSLSDIGIAAPQSYLDKNKLESWEQVRDVAFLKEQPLAAAIAAKAMQDDAPQLVACDQAVAKKQAIITPNEDLPAGYSFQAPQNPSVFSVPNRALAVNPSSATSEEKARAAAEFVRYAEEHSAKVEGPAADTIAAAVAGPATPAAPATTTPAAQSKVSNTLVVLDTSEGINPVFPAVSTALADRIRKIGAAGAQVGLWNYSSPMSPGVTRGWRPNVGLEDTSRGENAATAVTRFGTGGKPLTHATLVSALQTAQDYAKESNKPQKVVFVTTGTADAGAAGQLDSALAGIDTTKVQLQVVHVGDGEVDKELSDWASSHGGAAAVASKDAEFGPALDKAFGN
ncbi:vWA domain-containing protein [Corynebacterium sp. H128]|uniref:vWA domain-containing protein n=1 Tax=Corynebacterium sp. H128 TaxID=3133427 RepID=UPI0030A955BB